MKRRDFLRAAAASAIAACAPTTTPTASGDIVAAMSLERKVGQLMSVAFHGTKITSSLESMIRDRGVGGVILYSENFTDAAGLAQLVADLHQIARDAQSPPLFFQIGQESGPRIKVNKNAPIPPGPMAPPAIMSAHIVVPALDATPELPVTLSRAVMTDLLRNTLGFQGLVVTDDLEMGALKNVGEAAAGLRALQAGADYLLFRFDESSQLEGHRLITEAVRSGSLGSADLDESVRRGGWAQRRFGAPHRRRAQPAPDLA